MNFSTLKLNNLGEPHTVTAVEQVCLPDWNEDDCPWCQESAVLDYLLTAHSEDVSLEIKRRANRLRGAGEDGLIDDVFLSGIGMEPMALTPNSNFVRHPATQAETAAAVASAVQEMRTNENIAQRLVPHGFPLRTVLDHHDLNRYTDSILRAALLRVAAPMELRRSKEEHELERIEWVVSKLISSDAHDRQLRRELLVAILLQRLPRQALDEKTLNALREEGYSEFCNLILSNAI
jgi:hypothetical protein